MPQTTPPEPTSVNSPWSEAELASALFDGELSASHPALPGRLDSPELRRSIEAYAMISDSVHPGGLQPVSPDFQSRVMQAVLQEPAYLLPRPGNPNRPRRRLVSAIAAGLGAVGFVSAAYFVALPGMEGSSSLVAQGTAPVPVPAVAPAAPVSPLAVQVQSPWKDPHARRYMDAHGPTVVKLRLEPDQPE